MSNESDYIDFLRFSLNPEMAVPESVKTMDWDGLFGFAKKHNIVGIMSLGLNRLESEENPMTFEQIADWMEFWNTLKRYHLKRREYISELVSQIRVEGYEACLLKGEGVSMMYPDPNLRNVGDIDLWLSGTRKDIIRYVKTHSPRSKIKYMHSKLSGKDNTLIEIHYIPTCKNDFLADHVLQKYIEKHKSEQFSHHIHFPESSVSICTPTDGFNQLLLISHMMAHFIAEGAGFNLLVDYYYLLKRGFSKEEREETIEILKKTGMLKFARGVLWIEHHILGLNEEFLLTEPDEKVGVFLLSEVLEGGSYGQWNTRYNFTRNQGASSLLFQEFKRSLGFLRLFPREVLARPVFKIWHRLWQVRQNGFNY